MKQVDIKYQEDPTGYSIWYELAANKIQEGMDESLHTLGYSSSLSGEANSYEEAHPTNHRCFFNFYSA